MIVQDIDTVTGTHINTNAKLWQTSFGTRIFAIFNDSQCFFQCFPRWVL